MTAYRGQEDLDPLIEIEQLASERVQRAGLQLSELACENILTAEQYGLLTYPPQVMRGILAASIEAGRPSSELVLA
jgi:hypothetical protein